MNLELITLIRIAGMILTIGPIVAFLFFSIFMIKEISKDDDGVKAVITILGVVFAIGAVLLTVGLLG